MITREDERLLWKYIDGDLTKDEQIGLTIKLNSNEDLKNHLNKLKSLDQQLDSPQYYKISDAVKEKILQKTIYQHQHSLTLANLSWKSLGSFAIFNTVVLVFGLIILYFNSSQLLGGKTQLLNDLVQTFENPFFQPFFYSCIGILSLLFFDQYLKRRSHQRVTTPV